MDYTYTVSQKNDTDTTQTTWHYVAHYNFNAHQLILIIFVRIVAERAQLLKLLHFVIQA